MISITISKDGANAGGIIKDGNLTIPWEDLTREQQIELLNSIADIHGLLKRFLKKEGGEQ